MRKVKKTLYTLCVDNYAPEITALTFPLMQKYADKIGADFCIINDRKFPEAPPVYEKFQIYELGRKAQNDWNIFFDADTLIHPDFFDVTTVVSKDTTVSNGTDFVPHRFRPTEYHLRDGRMIGKGNWCAIASDWCIDYWHPLEEDLETVIQGIYPTVEERIHGITPCHLIDDYTVSYNIARYGLKHKLIPEIDFMNIRQGLLAHQYLMPIDQKVIYMHKTMQQWGLNV